MTSAEKTMLALLVIGGVGVSTFLLLRKSQLWGIGDIIYCDIPGDPGRFTITDVRVVGGVQGYYLWEGDPPFDDLGWFTEEELLAISCWRV